MSERLSSSDRTLADGWVGRAFKLTTLVAVFLAVASIGRASGNALDIQGSGDLGRPLQTAQLLKTENPYHRYFNDPIRENMDAQPARNPFGIDPVQAPSVLMFFWAFTGLTWPAAKMAWLAVNLLATAGICVLGFRLFLPGRSVWIRVALASLLVISMPWRNIIANGQHLLVGLFFYLLALDLADRKRPWLAGIALAGSLIKYSATAFLLPYLIWKRQWYPIAVAAALHAALTIGIAIRLGENPIVLVAQSFEVARHLQFHGWFDLATLMHLVDIPEVYAVLAGVACVVPWLYLALRKPCLDGDVLLAGLCFLSTVVLYHRAYDFVILFLPVLVAVRRWDSDRILASLIWVAVVLIWVASAARPWVPSLGLIGPYVLSVAAVWYALLGLTLVRTVQSVRSPDRIDDPAQSLRTNI